MPGGFNNLANKSNDFNHSEPVESPTIKSLIFPSHLGTTGIGSVKKLKTQEFLGQKRGGSRF